MAHNSAMEQKSYTFQRGQNVLSVADNGAELHFYINAVPVCEVADPLLPAGDSGLVVGARR